MKIRDSGRNVAFGDHTMQSGSLKTARFRPTLNFRRRVEVGDRDP